MCVCVCVRERERERERERDQTSVQIANSLIHREELRIMYSIRSSHFGLGLYIHDYVII